MKKILINPMANFLPAGFLRGMLRFGKSELAAANWADPGGWRSMVISYEGNPTQIADKILVGGGTIPMALRNRRRLGARILARLIDESRDDPAHVLCLGAGPGQIVMPAMLEANKDSVATLVDLSNDAFEYGRRKAEEMGLSQRIRFVQGDVREIHKHLDQPPSVVKMLGICEYLQDEQIVEIASAALKVMPPQAPLVFNSLSRKHGTERFFRRVFGLHMIHRSPEQLMALMRQAGLEDFVSFQEPLGVYTVLVGKPAPGAQAEG
jgi:SAM-dependent methyltransferase